MLEVETCRLAGVRLITPRRFGDDRGFFTETFNARAFAEAGVTTVWVQDNLSRSRPDGTVRGLHYQAPPHAQAKLVRCMRGAIRDVVVDVRAGSPTYGEWLAFDLTADSGTQMFVPEGFLHGFVTREADTEVAYKCSAFYAPDADGAVRFDDPELAIDWGIDPADAVLSDKDRAAPAFADFNTPFTLDPDA